jgi:hypothetical protein
MNMRFGTWNVRSPCRAGSFRTVPEEIAKCKLDLNTGSSGKNQSPAFI